MQKWLFISIIFLTVACNSTGKETDTEGNMESLSPTEEKFILQVSDIELPTDSLFQNSHFRGLHRKGDKAYLAGTNNMMPTYNFKTEEFNYFHFYPVPMIMEFRDVHFMESNVYYMSILKPSGIVSFMSDVAYESDTISFNYHFTEEDTTAFLDGMDFWDNGCGLAFGDPINGYPYILKSEDFGKTWKRISKSNLPDLIAGEAGFAASGSSVQCLQGGVAYMGYGGEKSRIYKTTDYGLTWKAYPTVMAQGKPGDGIYSLCFKDELNGVAVGGNWEKLAGDSSKIYTEDGGLTWQLAEGLTGYRSCVTHLKDGIYISTGSKATDISYDNGKTWQLLDSVGFNAIAFRENLVGIGIGNFGTVKLLKLVPNE